MARRMVFHDVEFDSYPLMALWEAEYYDSIGCPTTAKAFRQVSRQITTKNCGKRPFIPKTGEIL